MSHFVIKNLNVLREAIVTLRGLTICREILV